MNDLDIAVESGEAIGAWLKTFEPRHFAATLWEDSRFAQAVRRVRTIRPDVLRLELGEYRTPYITVIQTFRGFNFILGSRAANEQRWYFAR